MRIALDCRYVRVDRHDGISRYTVGLVGALAKVADGHELVLLVSEPGQLAHLPDLPSHRVSAPTSAREPLVARQVRALAPDVVFSPMQTMGSWGRTYPLVLTLHDLIYYRNRTPPPEFALPIRALWRLFHLAWWPQRALLNRADAVVTVSETTAGLIAEHRLTRRPVTVVPNAPDPLPDLPRHDRTPALVYMGSFMPYKNVATLAAAMGSLPDHELHLMSRVGDAERARLTALAHGGRLVFHDGVSDEEYHGALRAATALVSASRDEGFGIPLVEAMGLGTPVVVSDIPVFREVGGDAAAYVAPDDVAGFVRAVRELDDPDVWAARSAASRERAARYSWEASARVLLALLERVARAR
ncbi:glycosyltransferase family 4 protein [Pseudonocardia humida]|uniref:Glycosyltransferase family 4 protein n=1 Tax=Pseudonocardia humida TaxID=2800819 RepID=A0ABT0ZZ43_9PSEU|nr:glycosyltransferase family 1 protein [Pseudonocardia humida]MCO1655919.1 glycosyltransferase family 4 protein [Pseudonocardia humida]